MNSELIKEQAQRVQDELWEMAFDLYGLERNKESIKELQSAFKALIIEKVKEQLETKGIKTKPAESIGRKGDMAAIFMVTLMVKKMAEEGNFRGALDMLTKTSRAMGMIKVIVSFEQNKEIEGLSSDSVVKIMAATLAKKRHAENYALIEDALKYWHDNIDPSLSAQAAANELLGVVPLSHKKLAEVVSAEKKKRP